MVSNNVSLTSPSLTTGSYALKDKSTENYLVDHQCQLMPRSGKLELGVSTYRCVDGELTIKE